MEESMATFYFLDYLKSFIKHYFPGSMLKKTIDFLRKYFDKMKTAEYYSSKYTSAVQPSINQSKQHVLTSIQHQL